MNLVLVNSTVATNSTQKALPKDISVLRRMRIIRKITREDAAKAIERSAKLIERFENGRADLSVEKRKQLVRRYRFTWEEYLAYLSGQNDLPDLPPRSIFKSKAVPRIEGRKYQKQITKEARVLKVIRKMQGWPQPIAAQKCGWSRSCIDHLENGRVEMSEEKIAHILKAYGCKKSLFDELMEANILRDEVINDCIGILNKLDNDKLRAVKALLDNFR